MRAFVGLPLADVDVERFECVQSGLRLGRQVVAENLHLTLAFLDEQDTPTLEALHQELLQISAPDLKLRVDRIDIMGGSTPRVLCAMVAEDPALSALRNDVKQAARRAEIDLPRERFRPHITLARFPRHMEGTDALALYLGEVGASNWCLEPIGAFWLYQSVLAPEGPTYTPLAEYALGR